MLTVGDRFPEFQLKAVLPGDDSQGRIDELGSRDHQDEWRVFFFYPKDFTFVCPTELKGFADLHGDFRDRDAVLISGSTDSEFVHRAWRESHEDLRGLPYAMLADINKDLAQALGILDEEGVCRRATFIVDPDGFIRYASAHDGSVGRNPAEVLRVLDALQTDELCPCNWQPGEETLQVG
ncbi:MAG: peroxiredoxin [Planctomycetota bacterium]